MLGEEMRRTDSNISSTSSDILVASSAPHNTSTSLLDHHNTMSADMEAKEPPTTVRVINGIFVVRFRRSMILGLPNRLKGITTSLDEPPSPINSEDLPVDEGPNARGTFSKEYTLRHPEISWVHRGQGRYLPAPKVKQEVDAPLERRSRYVFHMHII